MSFFNENKWSDDEVEILITIIKMHPVLWNSSCHDYRDPSARNAAFNAIAQQIHMPTDEIRKKYRNLRTQYVREVRLIKTRGFGTKWNFYDSLTFLSSGQSNRIASQNPWHETFSEDNQDCTNQVPSSTKQEDFLDPAAGDESEICLKDYLEDTASLNSSDIDVDTEPEIPSKRIRLESATNNINNNKDKRRSQATIVVMKPSQKTPDEHDILGEHVATELRALEHKPMLQKSLKCAILQAILEVNKAVKS